VATSPLRYLIYLLTYFHVTHTFESLNVVNANHRERTVYTWYLWLYDYLQTGSNNTN